MSLYDYFRSRDIAAMDVSFYSIVMAAMREADTDNLAKLKYAWPEIWEELEARYHSPGGRLDTD